MNNNQRFVKKRLAQTIAASLIVGLSSQALANDFTIDNGQLTISNGSGFSQTVTVGANGVLGSVDNVPTTSNFAIPNFSFDLVNSAATPTNGTYTFEVGVAIVDESNSNNRRFEAYLGDLTLNVSGSTVTGTIPDQNLIVIARDGSVNATAVLNNASANGAITISGGSVTFSGANLVNRLKSANAAFNTILDSFNAGGQYTFRVVIQQTSGSPSTRFGRISSGTFSALPRVQTTCTQDTASQLNSVFQLNGTVNNNSYEIENQFSLAYAVQGKFGVGQAASTGALTAFTEDCTPPATGGGDNGGGTGGTTGETVVDQDVLDQQDSTLDNIGATLENELAGGGEVSENTVTQTSTVTSTAVENINNVVTSLNSGTTVNTDNLLNTLSVVAKAGNTGSTVANSTSNTTAKQQLIDNSRNVLNASASALTSLAASSQSTGGTLSSAQVTQVKAASTNLLNTASSLSTQSTSSTDIAAAARAAAEVINANRRLNVAADAALVTTISNASNAIATAAIRAVAGANVTDAEITSLLQNNQGLAEQVLNLALPIPPTVTESQDDKRSKVQGALPGVSADTANRLADATRDNFVVPNNIEIGGQNITTLLRNLFRGSTAGLSMQIIDETGRYGGIIGATTTAEADIIVDEITGAVKIVLPGETYSGAIVAVRAVPATVPNGIRVRRDGRTVIVTNGVAVELAPTALDVLAFGAAVEASGYQFSTRSNGSFGLNLGAGSNFSGTFAYDNLSGASSITNCGAISFVEPTREVNTAEYSFGIKCANGVTQRVVPYPNSTSFFESVTAAGLTATADRNSGYITVSGVGVLKPSFFVSPRTASEVTYYDANKDSFGLAYQAADVNGDGKIDYKVISATGTQLFYGVN
jgi:hypothetical protein